MWRLIFYIHQPLTKTNEHSVNKYVVCCVFFFSSDITHIHLTPLIHNQIIYLPRHIITWGLESFCYSSISHITIKSIIQKLMYWTVIKNPRTQLVCIRKNNINMCICVCTVKKLIKQKRINLYVKIFYKSIHKYKCVIFWLIVP